MPAQMRASFTCSEASEHRVKVQVKLGKFGELNVKVCSSPMRLASVFMNAPVALAWFEIYSGKRGATNSAVQVGPGRNCDWLVMANGRSVASCAKAAARVPSGLPGTAIERHSPISKPPKNGAGGVVQPSCARNARICSATYWPQARPRAIDWLFP